MASDSHAVSGDAPGLGHGAVHDPHGHALLHHHFDDMAQQRESNSLGMWLFLATELMMFGGLFFAYTLYRWAYPAAFNLGSLHQNVPLGTINTFVLLFSSLTMALAVHAAAERHRKPMVMWLTLTWILGAAFLIIKSFEWGHDYQIGLVPGLKWHYYADHPNEIAELARAGIGPNNVMMFWVIYFCMTGLHAIHMVIGLLLVGTLIVMGARGAFTNGNDQPVEISGLYWHLIDIVWIFLFPLLYLIAGFHWNWGGGGH